MDVEKGWISYSRGRVSISSDRCDPTHLALLHLAEPPWVVLKSWAAVCSP